MHVEQRILRQRNTPQGNFTILPTEVANLPTETGSGGCRTPTPPLSAMPGRGQIMKFVLLDHSSAPLRNPPFLAEPPPYCGLPPFYISANPLKFFRAERALGPTPIILVGNK